jgi:phosphoglycerate dehydrogenase-like enzyme
MKVAVLIPHWVKRLAAALQCAPSEATRFDVAAVDPADLDSARDVLRDAEIVVAGKFDRQIASLCPALRLLVCPWAGTENIDRAAVPAGVPVISGGGTEEPIAEYVIGALVALRHRMLEADRKLRAGEWIYSFSGGGDFVDELFGSTLGLLGYGRIGHEIAKRAIAFGMTCRALTMHPQRAQQVDRALFDLGALSDPARVDELVAQSDAIAICCELSDVTRGMIDARRLHSMKPNAVLVNVARGPIVVERDLYEALRDRRIAGAAIDVWYAYPEGASNRADTSAYPFGGLDNIIMTPHDSGWTHAAMLRRVDGIARAIEAFTREGRIA